MVVFRKLEDALQELEPLVEQGKVVGFFTNVQNMDKLGSLTEGIYEAVIDYQVCPWILVPIWYLISTPDIGATTPLQQEFPTHCEFCLPTI